MKRVVFSTLIMLGVAAVVLAMTPASALADTIDFAMSGGNGANSGWSWNGLVGGALSGQLTDPTGTLTVDRAGSVNLGPFGFTGTLNWTTGGFINTTSAGPFTFFNYAGGGSVSVTTGGAGQNINGTFFAANTSLFSGSFLNGEVVINGNTATFSGNFVIGNLNPNLLTALGLASFPTGANGTLSANLTNGPLVAGSAGSGNVASGDLTLTVPEPGTLVLLGTGLLGIGAMIRRKLSA